MEVTELVGSEVWKAVYEECWKMWREGFDKLRKAEDGRGAERAKQMMDDAERVLRMPLRPEFRGAEEVKNRYKANLGTTEAKVLRDRMTEVRDG